MRLMLRTLLALVTLATVAAAQGAPVPAPGSLPMEIRRGDVPPDAKLGRTPVAPARQSGAALTDAEREREPAVGEADQLVGVEALRHHDRGERVRVLCRISAEEREPERAHGAPAGLPEPRVAPEDVLEPLLVQHAERLLEAEEEHGRRSVRILAALVPLEDGLPVPVGARAARLLAGADRLLAGREDRHAR